VLYINKRIDMSSPTFSAPQWFYQDAFFLRTEKKKYIFVDFITGLFLYNGNMKFFCTSEIYHEVHVLLVNTEHNDSRSLMLQKFLESSYFKKITHC